MNENRSQNSKFENEWKFTKSEEKPAKTPNTKFRATPQVPINSKCNKITQHYIIDISQAA